MRGPRSLRSIQNPNYRRSCKNWGGRWSTAAQSPASEHRRRGGTPLRFAPCMSMTFVCRGRGNPFAGTNLSRRAGITSLGGEARPAAPVTLPKLRFLGETTDDDGKRRVTEPSSG